MINVLTMSFNRMYEENCYNNHSINNNLEIRAQGLSNNQMLESSVCFHRKQSSALFLSESSFVDGEEKLHTVRPGSIDPMTAVVQRVKGFAYYSLSFSRHNKNIKMEHFLLYILSRYFI